MNVDKLDTETVVRLRAWIESAPDLAKLLADEHFNRGYEHGLADGRMFVPTLPPKSQILINAERDPSYAPYCNPCPGLRRMRIVAHRRSLPLAMWLRRRARRAPAPLDPDVIRPGLGHLRTHVEFVVTFGPCLHRLCFMKSSDCKVPRETDGRYAKHETCEFCNGKIKGDYFSDEDTCNAHGVGMLLCDRKRCIAKREALTVEQRIAAYRANRVDIVIKNS